MQRKLFVVIVGALVGIVPLLFAACGRGGEQATVALPAATATEAATGAATPWPAASPGAPPAGSPINPCGLVAREEAAAGLGEPVRVPERADAGLFFVCAYNASHAGSNRAVLVRLYKQPRSPQRFRESFATSPELPGMGDVAFCAGEAVELLKGQMQVHIALTERGVAKDPSCERAKVLVARAASRLP